MSRSILVSLIHAEVVLNVRASNKAVSLAAVPRDGKDHFAIKMLMIVLKNLAFWVPTALTWKMISDVSAPMDLQEKDVRRRLICA